MCRAIADAHAVDEVKDIPDKALAIEVYARQAQNTDAEMWACQIRLRAERRAGQLLRDMKKLKGGRLSARNPSTDTRGLAVLGISYDQSSKWQQFADVPEDDFEAGLAGPDKPAKPGVARLHADIATYPHARDHARHGQDGATR